MGWYSFLYHWRVNRKFNQQRITCSFMYFTFVGLLFSLLFMPINFKAAKNIANTTGDGISRFFMYVQTIFILVCSVIFEVISNLIIQL